MCFEQGTKVKSLDNNGVVVENVKLPGDICVQWEHGPLISYDRDTAEAFLEIVDACS